MTIQPTMDPAASMALSAAVDEVAQAARYGCPPLMPTSRRPVTHQILQRLDALIRDLGYTPQLGALPSDLSGRTAGWPLLTVTVSSALPLAERVSVACHEISHVLLGHTPGTPQEVANRIASPAPVEVPSEEAAVELAAAAVMRVAGLGDGRSEAEFIATKMSRRIVPQEVRDAARLAARVLWAAVFEGK